MSRVTQAIETKPPIMDMRTHFFPEIHVRANPEADLSSEDAYDLDFVTEVEVQSDEKRPDDRFIYFTIKTNDPEKSKAWQINVCIVGQFRYKADCPEENRTHLAYVTGQSIIYGIAREMIHTLTLKGPFEPVYLPTITFVPSDDEVEKAQNNKPIELENGDEDE